MQNQLKWLALAPLALLTGCASITEGTHQTVSVTTAPVKGAHCKLSNSKGTWYIKQTPGSAKVHQAYGELTVACRKPGYAKATRKVFSHTKGMAFGNVVFGGAIGAGIDAADGAAYQYPNDILVTMHRRGHHHAVRKHAHKAVPAKPAMAAKAKA